MVKGSKVFQARFTNLKQFEYIHKTTENVRRELENQFGSCSKNQAVYHIFKIFNNGHEIGMKNPEAIENEEVVNFYDQPEQKERVISLLEQKHLTLSEQTELITLAESFNPSFQIINLNDIKSAIRIYYLKTEPEPSEFEEEEKPLETYYCGECECIHYNRGVNYSKHLEFAIEYSSEENNKPYKCTECNRIHKKGKIYEDHKQYAEVINKQ